MVLQERSLSLPEREDGAGGSCIPASLGFPLPRAQQTAALGFVWLCGALTFSTGSGRKEGSGSDGEGRESLFFGNVAKPSIGKHPSLAALNKPTWAWVSLINQLTPTQRL